MKIKNFLTLSSIAILAGLITPTMSASAEKVNQSGNVTVKDSGITLPEDPEKPGKPVDPGGPPQVAKGSLRIDYVSPLNFGNAKIVEKDRKYDAQAQLFHDDTAARGSYIQITDRRESRDGWTLQVTQQNQFISKDSKAAKNPELTAAVLSYDNAWANAIHANSSNAPTPTRETLALIPGVASNVAVAENNTGYGVWTIEFGASESNSNGQKTTLYPLLDKDGKEIIDSEFNKPISGNSAVTLSVPDTTKIYPVKYETEIIWTLAKLP